MSRLGAWSYDQWRGQTNDKFGIDRYGTAKKAAENAYDARDAAYEAADKRKNTIT